MKNFKLALAVAASVVAIGAQANAAVLTGSLSAWQAAVGTYAETTTFGTLGSSISGFTTTDGVGVSISPTTQVHAIGSGWATWSGGYTGQVLADYGSLSVTYTLGSAVSGFGAFFEPNPFSIISISMMTSDGQTLTQNVDGNAGAQFFGWYGGGITSFTVTSSADFAVGDVFSAAGGVPEPATWAMMIAGFGLVGATLRRRSLAVQA